MGAPALSVIVTTYRNPRSLQLSLAALASDVRSLVPTELIVADDGDPDHQSLPGAEDAARSGSFVSVRRVWQVHHGYGKCRLGNKAAAGARAPLLFFLDGDSLVAPGTVAAHLRLAGERRYVAGSMVRLGPEASAELDVTAASIFRHASPLWLALQAMRGRIEEKGSYFLFRLAPILGRLHSRTGKGGFNGGCSSLPRALLEEVNGWDESLPGYGFDDTDLGHRLQNAGAEPVSARAEAMVMHLWHDRPYRPSAEEYERKRQLVAATLKGTKVQARRGLAEMSADDPATWTQIDP